MFRLYPRIFPVWGNKSIVSNKLSMHPDHGKETIVMKVYDIAVIPGDGIGKEPSPWGRK